jgi:hypothetical protein
VNETAGLKRAERFLSFAILFISAWNFCLPVVENMDLPWWGTKVQIAPAVFINEALFLAYLGLGGFRQCQRLLLRMNYPNRLASICLIALAAWCAISSLLGPLPLHDAGRSARLVVMALLLMAVTHWSSRDPRFVLRAFLMGLIAGTTVNLFFTFKDAYSLVGILPRLLGQNTPGPAMGIAVCLSAWLLLLSRRRNDVILAVLGTGVCGTGALISYSKIGLFACFMGILCVAAAMMKIMASQRQRQALVCLLLIVPAGILLVLNTARGQETYSSFRQMLHEKIESANPTESLSMQIRTSYLLGVGEIVLSYPIGVGFSGFKEAMMRTEAYQGGGAADEEPISAEDSNPHAFFLYYASAGGLVGGLLGLAAFSLLWRMLHRALRIYGFAGVVVANLSGMAYLIMAISVPYLLNSVIMIVPAALAGGILIWSMVQRSDAGSRSELVNA